jgi:Leucine-rich repeat (LRR) protein
MANSIKLKGKKIKVEKIGGSLVLNLKKKGIANISDIIGLSKLSTLEELDLSDNNITEINGLENLSSLQTLNLRFNKIKEIKGLDKLSSLKSLQLAFNKISNISGLSNNKSLQNLELIRNQISDLNGLFSLTDLRDLDIYRNNIAEIHGLTSLTNLRNLNLSSNNIAEIKGLTSLTNLRNLNLSSNNIAEIKSLESLISLEQLDLNQNKITQLKGLAKLLSLTKLQLEGNNIITRNSTNYGPNGETWRIDDMDSVRKYCQWRLEVGERGKVEKQRKENIRIQQEKEKLLAEKFKDIFQRNSSIQMEDLRNFLNMESSVFMEKIIDWAIEYGFKIDGSTLLFSTGKKNMFLDMLDNNFNVWGDLEASGLGKKI